jgi:hypothetical protein
MRLSAKAERRKGQKLSLAEISAKLDRRRGSPPRADGDDAPGAVPNFNDMARRQPPRMFNRVILGSELDPPLANHMTRRIDRIKSIEFFSGRREPVHIHPPANPRVQNCGARALDQVGKFDDLARRPRYRRLAGAGDAAPWAQEDGRAWQVSQKDDFSPPRERAWKLRSVEAGLATPRPKAQFIFDVRAVFAERSSRPFPRRLSVPLRKARKAALASSPFRPSGWEAQRKPAAPAWI